MVKSEDQSRSCKMTIVLYKVIQFSAGQFSWLTSVNLCEWSVFRLAGRLSVRRIKRLTQRFLSMSFTCSYCREAGWGVKEAGWKHKWRVANQRLLQHNFDLHRPGNSVGSPLNPIHWCPVDSSKRPASAGTLGKEDAAVGWVECYFTSTVTLGLLGTGSPGRPPRLSHSSWAVGPSAQVLTLCMLGP